MPRSKAKSQESVSKKALANAESLLKKLDKKKDETVSLSVAIGQLKESLTLALGKGYSYDELAKILTKDGIKISMSTLKSYFSASKRFKRSTTTRSTRSKKSK